MQTVATPLRHVLAAADSDPFALVLPVFVILIALTVMARILKGWYSPRIGALCRTFVRGRWFLAAVVATSFALTIYLGHLAAGSRVDLEVDMRVSAGQFVELRANDPNLPPLRLPVVADERHIYRFEDIPASLTYLRLDPTDASGGRFEINSISIVSAGRVLRWFGPGDVRSWRLLNAGPTDGCTGFCAFSTTEDPILETRISFVASPYPRWVELAIGLFRRPHIYALSAFVWFLIFLAAGIGTARGARDAGLVATIAVLAYPLAILARNAPMSPPPVTSAIGYVNYHGYPKGQDYLISFVLLFLCGGLAWLVARFWSAEAIETLPQENLPQASYSQRTSRLIGGAVCLVLLALYLPNLQGELEGLRRITFHPVDWDSQNSLFWSYLVSHGYLPFRDFWYPYSGFFAHLLRFPTGSIIRATQNIATLWFLYLALRRILPRFRSAAIVLLLFTLLPVFENEFSGWFRYLLGVDLALLYVGLQAGPRPERRLQAWFAALVAFALWYEPAQLVSAGAGILAHIGLSVWPKRAAWVDRKAAAAQLGSALRRRLVSVAVPGFIGVSPVLLLLLAEGMLPGFIAFLRTMPDISVYGALPADVLEWTFPVLRFDAMFLSLFLTLVLAFYGWFLDRRQPRTATVSLLVVCLVGVITMQKQLMRPPIMVQLQIYPYLAILLYGVSAWRRRTWGQAAVAAILVGNIAGIAQCRGTLKQIYLTALSAPRSVAGDVNVILSPRSEIRRATAGEFDPARFAEFRPENDVVRVLRTEFGWTSGQNLYVLGDDAVFYILAGQPPPYVTNNYNCSPLVEQEHVLKWLQTRRPRFVVWNPANDSFDAVPNIVRLPLIYAYVVEHYGPLKTVGPYQILINTAERASTDPLYWSRELGNRIDLGHIPQLTRASEYKECDGSRLAQCVAALSIRFAMAEPTGRAIAIIDSSVGPMQVQFDLAPGYKDYVIDLDRLWFRRSVSPGHNVALSIPGADIRQERWFRMSEILY